MSQKPGELVLRNPGARRGPVGLAATRAPLDFHRRLPGYAPTPLVDAPEIAAALGVSRVLVKVEASRFGLPAFKMLGVSWATYQVLVARLGCEPSWTTVPELAAQFAPLQPLTLVTATDGNHGRAVAAMARFLGLDARIFVPDDMVAARIAGIESEGAAVQIVAGSYDDAVAHAAYTAGDRHLVISDTAWPGYTEPPRRVMEGYSTIFFEIEDALAATAVPHPTIVFTPAGVGALAAATVAYVRGSARPGVVVSVEPADAACVLHSCVAGAPTAAARPAPLDDGRVELRQRLPRRVAGARAVGSTGAWRSRTRAPSPRCTCSPTAASRAVRPAPPRSPAPWPPPSTATAPRWGSPPMRPS